MGDRSFPESENFNLTTVTTSNKMPTDRCQSIHEPGNSRRVIPSPDVSEVVRRKSTKSADVQCSTQTTIDGESTDDPVISELPFPRPLFLTSLDFMNVYSFTEIRFPIAMAREIVRESIPPCDM